MSKIIKSKQILALENQNISMLPTTQLHGKTRIGIYDIEVPEGLTIGDVMELTMLPVGKSRLLYIYMDIKSIGTNTKFQVGLREYKTASGVMAPPEIDIIKNDIAGGTSSQFLIYNNKEYISQQDIMVIATIKEGTTVLGGKISGYIMYVSD